MCCRVLVAPIPPEPTLSLLLKIAGFEKRVEGVWQRKHDEGTIEANTERDGLLLRLSPGISLHTKEEHEANAGRAAILFKLAMTLAEQADSTIQQESLRGDCIMDAGFASGTINASRTLAVYPDQPLRFEGLCLGFREVLFKGVGQDA